MIQWQGTWRVNTGYPVEKSGTIEQSEIWLIKKYAYPWHKKQTSMRHVAPSPSQAIDLARPCIT